MSEASKERKKGKKERKKERKKEGFYFGSVCPSFIRICMRMEFHDVDITVAKVIALCLNYM